VAATRTRRDALPLHATAAGKVLLALKPALLGSLRRSLTRFTPYTIVTPGGLDVELGRIRARGIAVEKEEHQPGTIAVATVLSLPDANYQAAIAVTAPSSTSQPRLIAAITAVVRPQIQGGSGSQP
jgi:IclR family transcriptional regulator, acetate operon repressor